MLIFYSLLNFDTTSSNITITIVSNKIINVKIVNLLIVVFHFKCTNLWN